MNWFANVLIKAVLDWLRKWISELIAVFVRDKKAQAENKANAAQDSAKSEALGPDSSEKEVSDAIDDSTKHF